MIKKQKNKKTKKQNKVNSLFNKKNIAIVLLCFILGISVVYSINYFTLSSSKKISKNYEDNQSTATLMKKMKKMLDEEKKRVENLPNLQALQKKIKILNLPPVTISDKIEKRIKKDVIENPLSEIKDYKRSLQEVNKNKKPLHVEKKKYVYQGKPKLAIIIDDVAFAHQTKLIKKIPFKVSPSFFPPTSRHPYTVKLSHDFKFAMVHLPTQALAFDSPEEGTLNTTDNFSLIQQKIKKIKKEFPDIKYYNNHTGSKFTADYSSMDKLIRVMKNEHLQFVDSRTTALTKAPQIAKKYNVHLFSRDVFLDNSIDKEDIKKQLLKAVEVAKKHGFAIAIGHPHENTLNVLINSKYITKDVDLVYLKDL